jgi:hypothetical protein
MSKHKPEPEVVEIESVWIDAGENDMPDAGDIKVLLDKIYELLPAFNGRLERMRIAICSELIHKIKLGDK